MSVSTGPGSKRPLPIDPAGRRVAVIDMRRRAEESVLADFPLVGALGQIGMGLAGLLALDMMDGNGVLHRRSPEVSRAVLVVECSGRLEASRPLPPRVRSDRT